MTLYSGDPTKNAGALTTHDPTSAPTTVEEYTGTGGADFGGEALIAKAKHFFGLGGTDIGGSAGLAKVKAFLGEGGIDIGGSALLAIAKAFAASGGTEAAGAAALAKAKAYVASGGADFAGVGSSSFVSAVPQFFIIGDGRGRARPLSQKQKRKVANAIYMKAMQLMKLGLTVEEAFEVAMRMYEDGELKVGAVEEEEERDMVTSPSHA